MRFKNDSKATLILGNDVIRAKSVSRDFTDRELEENYHLKTAIARGRITEFKGAEPKPVAKVVDTRYIMDDVKADKPVVNPKTKVVVYIMADSAYSDPIHMADNTMVIANDGTGKPPADYIEDGFDARAMKNASEAMEDQMNKEHGESTYDDDDTLADSEGDMPNSVDVDDAMAQDYSQLVKSAGKSGAVVTTAQELVRTGVDQAVNDMNKAASDSDEEPTAVKGSGRVVEIMQQPFFSKKKMVAKETSKDVLNELGRVSNSESIKSLVKQRLAELG
jgi:hypothetical protein